MCAIDYDDPCDIQRSENRAARKPHTCEDCTRAIRPGERYMHYVWLYEGRWSSLDQCRHCAALGAWMTVLCGGYPVGGLLEELAEHWEEGYRSFAVGRWTVYMRRRWRDGADPVPEGVADAARLVMAALGVTGDE